mgnify:CR=1 FL=1
MFIREIKKKNGPAGKIFSQFSLVQNFRVNGVVKQRNLLYLGSNEMLRDPHIKGLVVLILKSKIFGQASFFPLDIPKDVQALADSYYNKYVVAYGNIPADDGASIPPAADKADYHQVDISKLNFIDVKSFGAENLCRQIIHKLELDKCLADLKWEKDEINKALIAICGRAVFSSSEYKTAQYLADNSELTSLFNNKETYHINHKKLYDLADQLYRHREQIDKHIYHRVCHWFNLQDRLLIFDISNTYFESPKYGSQLAKFGRSKEKRTDCKVVVFTGVINAEGFIRHSKIYEGNQPDAATLEDMIADLEKYNPSGEKKTVVIDAGIASEENLAFLRSKGYKYVCVSRSQLKNYTVDTSNITKVQLKDKNETTIDLSIVDQKKYPDTWMYVKSAGKEIKETSMNEKLSKRFLEDIQNLKDGLQKKGAVKKVTKVYERLGRIKQQHRRVAYLYEIEVAQLGDVATDITWQLNIPAEKQDKLKGIYFIRTNHDHKNESQLWEIYNCIREVESTFRCLKSDLNMRPVHHQTDFRIKSHIYLTTLAYQLINTVKYMLKQSNINIGWKNILRLMSTQIIQTATIYTDTKTMHIRKPSVPTQPVKDIYMACGCKPDIKAKRKYVVYH